MFIVDKLGQIVEACQLQSALSNCPGVGFAGSSVNVPLTRTSARHFREHEYDSTFLGSWRGALDPCLTGDTLYGMNEVTIRELRNRGGLVLDRVTRGEAVTVTRDGHPVAELRPLPRHPLPAATLLGRWRRLPAVDAAQLRADVDAVLDATL